MTEQVDRADQVIEFVVETLDFELAEWQERILRRMFNGAATDLVAATESTIAAADHLTPMDDAAVEAMRSLARKIDAWDTIVGYALDDLEGLERPGRPTVPQNDNVSLSAYLKFCESLGLTPAGRVKLVEKKPEAKGGKLGRLQSVPKPNSA